MTRGRPKSKRAADEATVTPRQTRSKRTRPNQSSPQEIQPTAARKKQDVSTLEKIRRKIAHYQRDLERINLDADDPALTKAKKQILDTRVDKAFESIQQQFEAALEACDNEELDILEQESNDTNCLYENIKVKLLTSTPPRSQGTIQSSSSAENEVRLPKVNLPEFSGDRTGWPNFADLFTVSVHNRPNLSDSRKYQYLKGALTGEAAKLVRHLKITDANYKVAWDILVKRYENQREIIYEHIRKLISLKNTSLRDFLDDVNENVSALEALGQPIDQWDAFLNVILYDKLDSETRAEFERTLEDGTVPSFSTFATFVEAKARATKNDQDVTASNQSQPAATASRRQQPQGPSSTRASTTCFMPGCQEKHPPFLCEKFKRLTAEEKWGHVRRLNLCFNCFSSKHPTEKCRSIACRKCGKHHHTLLHEEISGPRSNFVSEDATSALLPTALIKVITGTGELLQARAMLDPGSQVTLITDRFVKRSNLTKKAITVPLSGISTRTTAKGKVEFEFKSTIDEDFRLSTTALVVNEINRSSPPQPVNINHWEHVKTIKLADPGFNVPGEIDILLGVGVWSHVIKEGILRGSNNTPTAQATSLGWVIGGNFNDEACEEIVSVNPCFSLDKTLTKFWELETLPEKHHLTPEEKACESHFEANTKRLADGSYQVMLPLQANATLGDSRAQAIRRLFSLERKFDRQPELKAEYSDCLSEYLTLGHMELVPKGEINLPGANYLPHHAVIKESSLTTKLRIVFDASARTSNEKSFNDVMLNGPTLQSDIFTILSRFRTHPVVLTADVEKMYRQIHVDPSQTDLQRIVWRQNPNDPIQHYRLRRLTFGTKSAPYLAVKTLFQLSEDEADRFPEAAPILKRDSYMDDLMTGESSVEKAKLLRDELINLTKAGGFSLRKWASNKPELLEDLPESNKSNVDFLQIDDESIKILGLQWRPKEDTFIFNVHYEPKNTPHTKRSLLSDASKIFDPLGFLAPTTVKAKIIFQRLWLQPLAWDDPLPPDIQREWDFHQREIHKIGEIKIPRFITQTGAKTTLCGFSDASEAAYSAVIYARTETTDGNVSVKLLAAKTRVAPLQTVALPRLELCGALLLAQLMETVRKATGITDVEAWTDSTVVLAWLSSPPSQWKTFIANRTSEIQEIIPPANWHHVRSAFNPADCASRGISPDVLVKHELWWNGPPFLYLKGDDFRKNSDSIPKRNPAAVLKEKKKNKVQTNLVTVQQPIYSNSSFRRLIRVMAFVKRFISNTLANLDKKNPLGPIRNVQTGPLSVEELHEASLYYIKLAQKEAYQAEFDQLHKKGVVHFSSKLYNLAPFCDEKGLLRVSGRLENSCLSTDGKNPIILPPDSAITEVIVNQMHRDFFHANTSLLLNFLQHRYWIPGTGNTIRRYIRTCVTCIRYKAQITPQLMADLPTTRVTPHRAFEICGVDYAGPFIIKQMNKRSQVTSKGYVAIFVCFATRAAHIEVVSDMTTPTFLAALRRFISRRGNPTTIHSDCGSNFRGADKELQKLLHETLDENHDETVADMLSSHGIEWKFNPPYAPHFGGLWEAAVKSFKYHFKRVVGENKLNFEEFTTLATQIEALLNSRPLCVKSSDPNKLEALTPGHFLIGSALVAPPEPTLLNTPANRLSRWQLIQSIQQHFWRRWQNEYLVALQRRYKWKHPREDISEGQVVLVKDDNLPPSQWQMGRITALHPGKDQLVRVVTVRIGNKEKNRAISKIIQLSS